MGGFNPFKIIGDIVDAVVDVVVDIVDTVIDFVGDVVGFVLSPFGAFDTPNLNSQNAQQFAQGVTVTKNGTNVAVPVVYGFRRVGGALVYAETGSTNNQYLYAVFAVGEGPIQGIKKIYVDDVALPLPSNFYTDGAVVNVNKGKFKGRIKFQVRYGYQASNSNINSDLRGPNWNKKSRPFTRAAFVAMRFYWKEIETQEDADNNPFRGGIPQVKFDILGRRVQDIRRYNTAGLQSAFFYDPASTANKYSFNPANCILDYLLNPVYGAGIEPAQINLESFRIAAKKFAQTVSYTNQYSGPAVTMNTVVDTNQKVLDNVKNLLAGCRSMLTFEQGKYKITVEDGGNATDITSTAINIARDIDKTVLIGGITLNGERKKTKFNQVIVNYVDPDREFTNQQQVFEQSADLALDNNEKLVGEFTFHTLTNPAIAFETARMIYKKSRKQKTVSFTGTQELMNLAVGDIIRLTDNILQFNLDTFRVVNLKINNNLTVSITAVEHDATIYPATGNAQIEIAPQVFIPEELSVRPRKKDVPLNPIGLVPPNDPDAPITVKDPNGDPIQDSAGSETIAVIDSAGDPIVDSAGQDAEDPEEENPLPPEPEIEYNVIQDFFAPAVVLPTGPLEGEILDTIGTGTPYAGQLEVNPNRLQQPPTNSPALDSDPTWKTFANPVSVYPNTGIPFILYTGGNPYLPASAASSYWEVHADRGVMTTASLTVDDGFLRNWTYNASNNLQYGTLPSGIQYVDRYNYRYKGEHWTFVYSREMAERGNTEFDLRAALKLNIPQDTSFHQYKIYYEAPGHDGWAAGGGNNVGQSNYDTRYAANTTASINSIKPLGPGEGADTPRVFAKNIRFRWRKVTVDGTFEFEDRSELPSSYTWFDYKTGKSVTGNHIDDFLNYWLQNSGSLWQKPGQAPSASQTSVSTTHNLGG